MDFSHLYGHFISFYLHGRLFVTEGCSCEYLCAGDIVITNNTSFDQEVQIYHEGELIHSVNVPAGTTRTVSVSVYTVENQATLSWEAWYYHSSSGRLFQDEGSVTYKCNRSSSITIQ